MANRPHPRSRTGLVLLAVVLLGTAALAVGVQHASTGLARPTAARVAAEPTAPTPTHTPAATPTPAPTPATTPSSSPSAAPTRSRQPRPTGPATEPSATPTPSPTAPTPTPVVTTPPPALRRVLGPGDTGDRVREVQARLEALQWYAGDVTGRYDDTTVAAVKGFQDKRGFTVDGVVDTRTLRRIEEMSTKPTYGQLHNVVGFSGSTRQRLDPRCRTGRVLCIDKTGRTVRWVVDGTVRSVMDVRFGASYSPTREGLFHVQSKSRDHVSRLYGSAMPFAMFFSGGQAVHYSSDFAARGYAGASHGCVNVRDRAGVEKLFDQVRVGDAVVVYRA